jgi:hypothetical protein
MTTRTNTKWSLFQKIGFRFLFSFFCLHIFLNVLRYFLGDRWIDFYYYPAFIVQNYFLKLHATPRWVHQRTGGGDTLDDWTLQLACLLMALLFAIIWTTIDRKKSHYTTLRTWTKIGVRYYLSFLMLLYSITKLFVLQMPYPKLIIRSAFAMTAP